MPSRSLVRHGALAAALALVVLAGFQQAASPAGVRGVGPLPACRYDDIMTTPRSYDAWATTLVDTILRVPRSYVPPDLVSVASAGLAGHGKVRAVMIGDLTAMAAAAAAAGNALGVESAYRSYDDQVATFAHWVDVDGYAGALQVSARPGHSEHQLGLAIDFRSDPPNATLSGSWGQTPAGRWMREHAWEYGFIRSYQAHQQAISCYASEPWHYRYVGPDLAAAIHASGLTTREYLWANYTTAVVPLVTPGPTRRPGRSQQPSLAPSPEASPMPSGEPGASEVPPASQLPPPGSPPAQTAGAAEPTPLQSQGPLEPSPVADLQPGVALAIGGALLAVLAITVLVLRRGRSGVGL
jgi:D-alanyl-D-alanine carboxypeptidase